MNLTETIEFLETLRLTDNSSATTKEEQQQNKISTDEIIILKDEIKQLIKERDEWKEKYEKDKKLKAPQKAEVEAIDSVRKLVEGLIIFAENYPSNQNDKAEVIKTALLTKGHNGLIPAKCLTEEWDKRLQNLGRKEPGIHIDTLNTGKLYDIHDNTKVNL